MGPYLCNQAMLSESDDLKTLSAAQPIGCWHHCEGSENVRGEALQGLRMSNHYHMLLAPKNAQHIASFIQYGDRNISDEVGRLNQWPGTFWTRR